MLFCRPSVPKSRKFDDKKGFKGGRRDDRRGGERRNKDTIGIITFNKKQQDRIEDLLERRD